MIRAAKIPRRKTRPRPLLVPCFVPPPPFPAARPRGLKAVGLAYQLAVTRLLAAQGFDVAAGPWIRAPSGALSQPDILLEADGKLFVIECKLGQNDREAVPQLLRYARLLEAMGYAKPVRVQTTSWVRKPWRKTYAGRSFAPLATLAKPGERWLWSCPAIAGSAKFSA